MECLLIFLGFWQLHRAHFKEKLLSDIALSQAANAVNIKTSEQLTELSNYSPVKLTGHYDNEHTILLDNKVHQGRVGVWTYTPFFIGQSDTAILVNRGWLAFKNASRELPEITPVVARQVISGQVVAYPGVGLKLGAGTINEDNWPLLMTYFDQEFLERQLGYKLSDKTILLDSQSDNGFVRNWNTIKILPERHYGYAVQWFALAITLFTLIIWCYIKTFKKTNEIK